MIGEKASKQYRALQTAAGVTLPTYIRRSQTAKQKIAALAKK